MIVLKFGGTSMGSANRMKQVAGLVQRNSSRIVVLSAMAGVTDKLVETANHFKNGDNKIGFEKLQILEKRFVETCLELFQSKAYQDRALFIITTTFQSIAQRIVTLFSPETERWLIVQGEMITSAIFAEYLQEIGIKPILLNAPDFMLLDETGEPDMQAIERLLLPKLSFAGDSLYVTQGFVCRNHLGEIDNLKRGGSDYSATLIGAIVKAGMIEIWTDIDGMQNNDPREVNETFPVRSLSFDEAAELAYFGAKILHPACVLPAQKSGIPIWLRNTMDPDNPGTLIRAEGEQRKITAIAAKDHITAIKIKSGRMLNAYGFLVRVFQVFENHQTPLDMITTSEVAVSLTIDNDQHLFEIITDLSRYGTVEFDQDQSIICVVGDFLADHHGYPATIFQLLRNIPIRMISYGGSKNNVSFLVATKDKKQVLNELNNGLFPVMLRKEVTHA
jgi:aspartate kinase